MKNITLKIDAETYRKARMRAAKEGTSVSAMVRQFLIAQAQDDDERDARRVAALDELYRSRRGAREDQTRTPEALHAG